MDFDLQVSDMEKLKCPHCGDQADTLVEHQVAERSMVIGVQGHIPDHIYRDVTSHPAKVFLQCRGCTLLWQLPYRDLESARFQLTRSHSY